MNLLKAGAQYKSSDPVINQHEHFRYAMQENFTSDMQEKFWS